MMIAKVHMITQNCRRAERQERIDKCNKRVQSSRREILLENSCASVKFSDLHTVNWLSKAFSSFLSFFLLVAQNTASMTEE